MEHVPASKWKHATTEDSRRHGEPVGINLYDDDQEGYTSIYLRFRDGKLFPARTVDMGDAEHAKSVLGSWLCKYHGRAKLRDRRTTYKGVGL